MPKDYYKNCFAYISGKYGKPPGCNALKICYCKTEPGYCRFYKPDGKKSAKVYGEPEQSKKLDVMLDKCVKKKHGRPRKEREV